MALKSKSSRLKTYWIRQSKVDDETLVGLIKEGLTSDVSMVRLPKDQEFATSKKDEVLVFMDYF